MRAKLQKLSANKDSQDSIQFQLREEEVEEYGEEILALRRYDYVSVSCESEQSSVDDDGVIGFPTFKFQATNTSISLCVTEKGIIATITFSFEEGKVFEEVIKNKLRNRTVTLYFEAGKSPYTAK